MAADFLLFFGGGDFFFMAVLFDVFSVVRFDIYFFIFCWWFWIFFSFLVAVLFDFF